MTRIGNSEDASDGAASVVCDGCGRDFAHAKARSIHRARCAGGRDALIVARYRNDESVGLRDLADAFGLGREMVRRILDRAGVLRAVGGPPSEALADGVLWYERGGCPACDFAGDGDAVIAHGAMAHGLTKERPVHGLSTAARQLVVRNTRIMEIFTIHEVDVPKLDPIRDQTGVLVSSAERPNPPDGLDFWPLVRDEDGDPVAPVHAIAGLVKGEFEFDGDEQKAAEAFSALQVDARLTDTEAAEYEAVLTIAGRLRRARVIDEITNAPTVIWKGPEGKALPHDCLDARDVAAAFRVPVEMVVNRWAGQKFGAAIHDGDRVLIDRLSIFRCLTGSTDVRALVARLPRHLSAAYA